MFSMSWLVRASSPPTRWTYPLRQSRQPIFPYTLVTALPLHGNATAGTSRSRNSSGGGGSGSASSIGSTRWLSTGGTEGADPNHPQPPPPSPPPDNNTPPNSSLWMRWTRQKLGIAVTTWGFMSSATQALLRSPQRALEQTQEPLLAVRAFLAQSGVDLEITKSFHRNLAIHWALLGSVHRQQQPSVATTAKNKKKKDASSSDSPRLLAEAKRYMRYATAVYGPSMIHAAEIDARGQFQPKLGQLTLDTISQHVGIPPQDIVLPSSVQKLEQQQKLDPSSHFVAVDHAHRKVVLAIRGTFSFQDIVVDIASFSRENFCGGEAHAGMATMAEHVWEEAGPSITNLLRQNKGYELILTGHSLGAGTASLLAILLQTHRKRDLPRHTTLRCFAYACPPVFTPLEVVPQALRVTTNFVHENDVVPCLSLYSVRGMLGSLRAIQEYTQAHPMSWSETFAIATGQMPPPQALVEVVRAAPPVAPKQGSPRLYIPAGQTVWLKGVTRPHAEFYTFDVLPRVHYFPIRVLPNMFLDHLPSRYEYALDHIVGNNDNSGQH
eukprot:Nitzschia sp. Nitz4//scaffold104_size75438//6816//8468//NITZ4_005649-RA/size75438-processed-gene-0.58-mRNA-1//1//CDS//3329532365//9301//frame0